MKWSIFAVGKPKLAYAREGVEEYSRRLRGMNIHYLKPASAETEFFEKTKGAYRVALDEKGECVSTEQLARKIQDWQKANVRSAALFIGGSEGLSDDFRKKCDWVWSLSPLTFQHELALVIVLEQVYRAESLLHGHPYHRSS